MRRITRLVTVTAASTIALPFALPLRAQGLSVAAVGASANHELLGTLGGGVVGLRLGPQGRGVAFRLSFELLTGAERRTGVPCGGGPIPPGECPLEPVHNKARMNSVSAGLSTGLLRRPRGALDLIGELRLAGVTADTRGLTSGRTISAHRFLPGADLSLEGELRPRASWPVTLQLAASVGGLFSSGADCCDMYDPFNQAFTTTRIRLGLAWRPLSR